MNASHDDILQGYHCIDKVRALNLKYHGLMRSYWVLKIFLQVQSPVQVFHFSGTDTAGKYYYLEWILTGFWTAIYFLYMALQFNKCTTFGTGIVHVYSEL